jgi:replication factor A1
MYTPVKVLNQFTSDWRIKVRVTKKYDVKKWNNARGTGELFTIDLVDAEGTQIQGTFFNQQVQKFFPMIKENKVYAVSGGSLKISNKKFTSIPHDYCLNFFDDTEFHEVAEDSAISQEAYSFKNIKTLGEL